MRKVYDYLLFKIVITNDIAVYIKNLETTLNLAKGHRVLT